MVALKHSETRIIDEALAMGDGYVLDFSDRTFAEFFEDEFGVSIYSDRYDYKGRSKARHIRAFIETEGEYTVARVLRRLWEHRESLPHYAQAESHDLIKGRFFGVLAKIEGAAEAPSTDAIDRFASDETLDELIASIQRDIAANKPAPALDRLHTYCMKKFAHLLDLHEVPWERSEPLHSRVGKYAKVLQATYSLHEASRQIIKSAIGIFEKFNHVRNNDSLAHDNDLLYHAEARFIFDSVTALLRFVKCLEAGRFDT